jgi:hypothetical protein
MQSPGSVPCTKDKREKETISQANKKKKKKKSALFWPFREEGREAQT